MWCDTFWNISIFTDSVGSCLSSPFPHRILAFFSLSLGFLLWLTYWNFFVVIIKKQRVSLYPRLSHLSLLHLVIWTHFYFMYSLFSCFRLLNSSWILVLCLLKDSFFVFFLCFFYHSVGTGKISPHPTISLSPSYPNQQILLKAMLLEICALPLLPN